MLKGVREEFSSVRPVRIKTIKHDKTFPGSCIQGAGRENRVAFFTVSNFEQKRRDRNPSPMVSFLEAASVEGIFMVA